MTIWSLRNRASFSIAQPKEGWKIKLSYCRGIKLFVMFILISQNQCLVAFHFPWPPKLIEIGGLLCGEGHYKIFYCMWHLGQQVKNPINRLKFIWSEFRHWEEQNLSRRKKFKIKWEQICIRDDLGIHDRNEKICCSSSITTLQPCKNSISLLTLKFL